MADDNIISALNFEAYRLARLLRQAGDLAWRFNTRLLEMQLRAHADVAGRKAVIEELKRIEHPTADDIFAVIHTLYERRLRQVLTSLAAESDPLAFGLFLEGMIEESAESELPDAPILARVAAEALTPELETLIKRYLDRWNAEVRDRDGTCQPGDEQPLH
jgi:hypothetical protein